MANQDGDLDDGGGVVRSPRYPAISLKDAVAKVKAIYAKDKTAGTPLTAAYPLMGYKSKSGPAMTALAALKRFGLAEVRSGRVYPTKRGVAVSALPENDERHKAALKEAVLSPDLYKSWMEQYSETGLPSPESLKHELLLENRFNHNAVPGLVNDFFESLKFAGLTDASGVLLLSGGDDGAHEDDDEGDVTATIEQNKGGEKGGKTLPSPAAGLKDFPLYTSGPKGVLYAPSKMSKTDFELFKRQLESHLFVIEATSVVPDQPPN